uniref:Uncharacterized protein n=1 Tax=Lepeophtheirus salmonis TaxID=72036 RepID=A0A0K2U415_LEPSM
MEKDVNSPPISGNTCNETVSFKTDQSTSKTSKNVVRQRPNCPGWILKRANTVSFCFSRDNQNMDKRSSVYNLSNTTNESICEGLHHPSSEQSMMKFTRGCWQKSNDPMKSFCRGSLKKLRNAESKVIIAKKDVEDILIQV